MSHVYVSRISLIENKSGCSPRHIGGDDWRWCPKSNRPPRFAMTGDISPVCAHPFGTFQEHVNRISFIPRENIQLYRDINYAKKKHPKIHNNPPPPHNPPPPPRQLQ